MDLLPGLREAGASNPYPYYPINLHWTADGHDAAAGILLREMGLD